MMLFGLELRKAPEREARIVDVACTHCGRSYRVAVGNLRVGNYCTSCK